MKQRNQFIQNETLRNTLIGATFGLLFPIAATIIRIAIAGLQFNLSSVIAVQSIDPLLWIIDTAPFILGFVAMLAGRRQDSSHHRESELIQKESELIEFQNTLEDWVAERTKEVRNQSQRLRIVAELAKDAASSKSLSDLLEHAGQLIKDRFGFYHIGLFLIDTNREYAVLAASPTDAGRQMIINKYKLRVGYTSSIGRVVSTGESRVVLDTNLDSTYEPNPLLPNTRSELLIPLKVGNDTIGVLDVQSDQPQAFTEDDVAVIQILADQLTATIERSRLLQQLEQNINDLERAYGYTTRDSWNSFAGRELISNTGYRFDNVRIQPIKQVADLGYEALKTGNSVIQDGKDNVQERLVAIPIKVRGQPIGVVTAKLKEGYKRTMIETLEQAVDRFASSLESARLFEEARHRADREQAILQVTTAISSAADFDDILRTTVEEIGKSLGDSEVSIQIVTDTE